MTSAESSVVRQLNNLAEESRRRRWLATVVIEPRGTHTSSLFWCHGYMGDAQGYFDESERYWQGDNGLKVYLINAPQRKVTCSRNVTNAWYDYITDREGEVNDVISTEQFSEVVACIHHLLQEEILLLGAHNVSIGGYSQGGTVALHAGLTWTGAKLGGIYAIQTTLLPTTPAVKPSCKIHAYVGFADEVFPWHKWARDGWARLVHAGAEVDIYGQDDIHHVDPEWESAVVRHVFRNGPAESILKLRRVEFTSQEQAFAGKMEAALRVTRLVVTVMRRFQGLVVGALRSDDKRTMKELCEDMQAWFARSWAMKGMTLWSTLPSGNLQEGELVTGLQLNVCALQSGPHSCSDPLLAYDEAKNTSLPTKGAVVLSLAVGCGNHRAYLTRTIIVQPTGKQREAYRFALQVFESFVSLIDCSRNFGELLSMCKEFNEAPNGRGLTCKTFNLLIRPLQNENDGDVASPLRDDDVIMPGAYLVAVAVETLQLPGDASQVRQDETVWIQDVLWVQNRPGSAALVLTQNASKEEACVMYEASDSNPSQDDLSIAKQALSNIRRILASESSNDACVLQSLRSVLNQEDLQHLFIKDGDEEGGEGEDE